MKNMHRREFSTALLGASALAVGLPAAAQGGPVEGTHYVRLGQPLAVTAPAGKVEVVEFFWYGCPHCNVFEPMLEAWAKKLPADVSFRRVPVAFRDEPFGTHQRIMSSGFVHAANTCRAGPLKVRVTTSSRSPSRSVVVA